VSQKNFPNIFDCNLKKDYQNLIIVGRNIYKTNRHQKIIQYFTSPKICFCTTWENSNQRNITFLPKVVLLLNVNNAQKHIFHVFDTMIDISSNCFVFELLAVKLVEMLAHCASTDTDMLSPIDNSVDNVLLHTNPNFISSSWIHKHSWKSSGRHNFAWQSNLVICWFLGTTNLDRRNLLTFFHSF